MIQSLGKCGATGQSQVPNIICCRTQIPDVDDYRARAQVNFWLDMFPDEFDR